MGIKNNLAVVLLLGLAAADDQPAGLLNAVESVVTANASPIHNGIESLLSQAGSLLQSQSPSTTTDLASLTGPTTVVIGSQTYTIPSIETSLSTPSSTSPSSAIASTTENARPILTSTASTTLSSATSASSSKQSSQTNNSGDKRLGIILGVVLGSIAIAIGAFLIWFLHRRRKNTGTFFKNRPSSPSDTEVSSWRTNGEAEKYGRRSDAPPLLEPQMAAHGGGGGGGYATRTWTNDDDDMNLGYHGYRLDDHHGPAELSAERSERGSFQRTATLEDNDQYAAHGRQDRPPTPFSPDSFGATIASPVSPIEQEPQRRRSSSGFWPAPPPRHSAEGYRNLDRSPVSHQPSLAALAGSVAQDYPHPYYQNPFASHEDYELQDGYADVYHHGEGPLTPDIPSRSPRRQSTPMVYYPSSDELGKFNFGVAGDGRPQRRPSELGA
ncbi:hypothetical protein M436DRAFT_46856 [Aureobasidium namibiae CBS 147.97]|uniref:Mid2 domain-containing protein n=1 Tax=Aureobasidium namibiae CBS 147.97 TaxID=1043004 RepID=A0A074XGD9_9PEZI